MWCYAKSGKRSSASLSCWHVFHSSVPCLPRLYGESSTVSSMILRIFMPKTFLLILLKSPNRRYTVYLGRLLRYGQIQPRRILRFSTFGEMSTNQRWDFFVCYPKPPLSWNGKSQPAGWHVQEAFPSFLIGIYENTAHSPVILLIHKVICCTNGGILLEVFIFLLSFVSISKCERPVTDLKDWLWLSVI